MQKMLLILGVEIKKITKILSIRINFFWIFLFLAACAAPAEQRASNDVGPVSAYARNTMAAENPQGLVRVGEGFEQAGDLRGARQLYGQAMAVTPQSAEARIAYARVSSALGAGDEAVAILVALIGEMPENRLARFTLSQVHANAGRYQVAAGILENLGPESPAEYVLDGKIAHILAQPDQAKDAFAHALDLAPNDASVLRFSALSFALTGDYASAVGLLRRALDQPAAAKDAQRSLALVYALSGQREAALALARDAMTPDEVQKIDLFYRLLPKFTGPEKASALFFDRLPINAIDRLTGNATN